MSRGSISSWQDYGRRNSQIMPQFSGGPVEFMTSDEMEYKRGDGWFLSYTKIAGIIVVFIIGVIAAGFLGWYINSLPKGKPFETLDLLTDEIEDIESIGEPVIPSSVHPLKYYLELTPIVIYNGSIVKGRVIIVFHINDTAGLDTLSLSAKNMVVERYKLLLMKSKENNRQRRSFHDGFDSDRYFSDTVLVSQTLYSTADDTALSLEEDKAVLYETINENSSENTTSNISSKDSLTNDENDHKINDSTLEESITRYEIDDEKEIHTIHLKNKIYQGVYMLDISYQVPINDEAFFIANYSTSDEEGWLMGTKLKRSGARYLFPVFADEGRKSVFSVSIIRSSEITVLSNMPLRIIKDTSNSSDPKLIDIFADSPPFAPRNFAFTMGYIQRIDEKYLEDFGVLIMFWCDSNQNDSRDIYLFDKLNPVLANMLDIFSMPFPFPKLDLVCLPPGIVEDMANPGLIFLKQSVFYTSNDSSLVTKLKALDVLVTSIGQQWLDEFTNANRTLEWIFEGSLIYFQHDIVPKIDLSLNSSDSFVADVQLQVMDIDGYSVSRPLHENANYRLLQSLNDEHAKGACLLRMLHGAISDTAFRNGYRKFVNRWEYNTTDITDFMNLIEEEEATGLPSEISLDEAMNSWITQGGYPLVTVMRNYEDESAIIYQEQFAFDRPLESLSTFWHIPLSYVIGHGNWSSPLKLWFPPEPKIFLNHIAVNESWVLFNVNKTGYYRVHYDERNWIMLKEALMENHELFPAETRASLVDDVLSLAASGLMKYELAFDVISYMRTKERHCLPWITFMGHMVKLNGLVYDTPVFNDFQEFVVKFISPLYSEVGSKIEEGSPLTMIAIRLACLFEHSECIDWSKNIFENAKTDKDIEWIVPSYIRETFYCTIARYGTRKEWNYFMERVLSVEDEEERRRLLSSFACFQAPWILQNVLNEILQEDRFEQDEILAILKAFPRNPAAAQAAFRFVRANWQEIVQRFSGSYVILKSFILSMVNGLTTEQDLEDLQMFREMHHDSTKGTRYAAAVVESNGNFVTMWLKYCLPQVESILKENIEKPSIT